jgi:hypothetical protein
MLLKDAIEAKLYPYELPTETIEFLLAEQGLNGSDEYNNGAHKMLVTKAVVNGLYQLVTLTKEKDNGSELQYDKDAIWALIRFYENEVKPESKQTVNRDMTHIW